MIQPTVGRVVWFYPRTPREGDQPQAALITYVWDDTRVNLAVFDPNGNTMGQTSVFLLQPGSRPPEGRYCAWMPYQMGQAAKTEALEKQLKG